MVLVIVGWKGFVNRPNLCCFVFDIQSLIIKSLVNTYVGCEAENNCQKQLKLWAIPDFRILLTRSYDNGHTI